jgi:threonine dehydrogenase-like Zn-dependent dehydrogenase
MEKFLTGVLIQDGRDFFERILVLIDKGKLDPSPLVSHVLEGWDKLEDALELMRSREESVIKPVIAV